MSVGEIAVIAAAGLAAGTINAVIGAGSLITFPALLALGYAPLVANVSNTVGLLPGSASGAIGYRRELEGQGGRARLLIPAALLGGTTGAMLLLLLPGDNFERVVPFLILLAVVLVAVQPWIATVIERWRSADASSSNELAGPAMGFTFLSAVYGGYFGAAQGVILMAQLGLFLPDDLQRLNALKNLLAVAINGVAALIFAFLTPVAWEASLVLAIGSIVGGQLGARFGRSISPGLLRVLTVGVGTAVAIRLLVA